MCRPLLTVYCCEAGSAVLVLYLTLYRKGVFSRTWQARFGTNPARIGAWTTSALIATFSVIGTAGVIIGENQDNRVLAPFGGFMASTVGWPLVCLRSEESTHPKGESAAIMLTALMSVWLAIAANSYGSPVLTPLTICVMQHHLLVDGLWYGST